MKEYAVILGKTERAGGPYVLDFPGWGAEGRTLEKTEHRFGEGTAFNFEPSGRWGGRGPSYYPVHGV